MDVLSATGLIWQGLQGVLIAFGGLALAMECRLVPVTVSDLVALFQWKTPDEIRADELAAQVAEKKSELATISEMDEFAAFHRKRRVLIRLEDEHKALASKQQSQRTKNRVVLSVVFHVVVAVAALAFSYWSRCCVVAHLRSDVIWPLDRIFTLFWTAAGDQTPGFTPVQLFHVFCLLGFCRRAYDNEKQLARVLKITKRR